MLEAPAEGRTSFEVRMLEGGPDCPYNNAKAFEACYEKIDTERSAGPGSSSLRGLTLPEAHLRSGKRTTSFAGAALRISLAVTVRASGCYARCSPKGNRAPG